MGGKRKNGKCRNRNNKTTKHHVIPKSRLNGRPLVVGVRHGDHEKYHELFGNMTPGEIIKHLVEYYWGGRWFFVYNALKTNRRNLAYHIKR